MKLAAAILLFSVFVTVQGLKFASDKYAILLTHDFPPGPIGEIKVSHQAAGIVYSLIGASQKVEVDSSTGKLKLLVNSSKVNNLKFKVRATFGNKAAKTDVQIIVLPLNHGDQFAFDAIKAVRVSLNLHKKAPPPSFFVPAALDILLQQAAEGDPVNGISQAEEIVEKAINLVKSKIIQQYEKQFGKGAVLAFLKNTELFSKKVMTGLDKEATCTVAETPVACLKKPIYRRFDGKCSNLKKPLAGAAGTPLVRIAPAVYYDVDGLNDPVGFPNQPNPPPLPSPFKVTKDFIKDEIASSVDPGLTPLMMQFGQFMDHDFTLSAEEVGGSACLTSSCDGSGNTYDAPCYPILPLENNNPPCIRLVRSAAMCQREGYPKVREQLNDITAVIDASNIYGSSKKTSDSLRDKTRQWIEIKGPRMKQIDTGMTNEVWAVSLNNDVFYLSAEKKWVSVHVKLIYVSAGASGVWGVDDKNEVYHYLYYKEKKHVPGIKLKQIDSGPEGIVMGVTKNNIVYCRSGITYGNNLGTGWKRVFGRRLKQVSCGKLGCWGVNANGKIYYREGVWYGNCAGRSWILIDGKMSQIQVGGNGSVYAVDSDDKLHIRQGITASNRYGTRWELLRSASHVTTGWTGVYLIQDKVTYHASDDEGKLRTSKGDLLPLDTGCKASACVQACFLAGDIRANDQQGLTAFHTMFLREHNRIAKHLRVLNAHWNGERIFQETRKIVGAKIQNIVYSEYLPILLGPTGIPAYKGHDKDVDPGVINAFTLAYRLGHSMIRSTFDLLNANFDPIAPAVQLRFLFFNSTTVNTFGVEPLLLGLVGNISEKVDIHLTKEITEHLFERGGNHGENLAALNIQRSRDHGLPGYNAYRKFSGLPKAKTFEDTKNEIQDPSNRNILKNLYNDNPDLVELWVAGIAESPVSGAAIGPTFRSVVGEQFKRARDGDRFFFENDGVFPKKQRDEIKKSNMARIFCDNVPGIVSIQRNAFKTGKRHECGEIKGMSLCAWKECLTGEPHFIANTRKCVCRCRKNIKNCPNKWTNAIGYQPPFPIYSKKHGDLGSRFIDLNGDGRMDFVYHQWTRTKISKGAYINDPVSKSFVSAPNYAPPYHIAAPGYTDLGARFVDLNGDGKADMVYHRYLRAGLIQKGAYINTGKGWKKAPEYTPPFHISADRHGDLGARFVDLNGDGKIDFVYHRWLTRNYQQKGAYINTGNGWAAAPNFIPPYHIAASGYKDLSARFIDLNGDGRKDLVYNRFLNNYYVQKGAYINNGQTWVWSPQFTPPVHITSDRTPDLGVRFVDLNGDSRDDLVYYRIDNKKNEVKGAFLNNGYRWIWSPMYTPRFPISADNTPDLGTRFADVNGDGLIDMLRSKLTGASKTRENAAINTGSGWKRDDTFIPPHYIARQNDKDAGARFVELDGDGAVDMVWSLKLASGIQKGAKLACAGNGNNVGA